MPALQSVLRPVTVWISVLMLAFLVGAFSTAVHAQTAGSEKPVEGATPGGVNDGSSSDSELWRQIRQGQSGTVVGGDKSAGLMIQSGGQDWRLIRNGPLPRYSAWAILGTLLLLSLFFAVRGRIRIEHGKSGRTMKRFSAIERAGHWLLASSFIVLALTGLNLIFGKTLLIPILGKDAFASITVFGKYIHNYVGFAFMLGLVMIAVMWVVHNIPNLNDLKWLLRGGGIVGGGHPPARKFNAGQKIIFWIVILCGASISLSGWALMNPFSTQMFAGTFSLSNSIFGTAFATDLAPIQEQQYQSLWHAIMAVFMTAVVLAHIYIGSFGMEGALSAMTTGEVDTNWAREHHSLWVEEEEAKAVATSGAPIAKNATTAASKSAARPASGATGGGPSGESTPAVPAAKPSAGANVPMPAVPAMKKPAARRTASINEESRPKRKATKTPNTSKAKTSSGKAYGKSKSPAEDDLKLIKGIGPQNEKRLKSIGIKRFKDVASWTKKEQADIGERLAFPGRIEREEWVKQAKELAKKATNP